MIGRWMLYDTESYTFLYKMVGADEGSGFWLHKEALGFEVVTFESAREANVYAGEHGLQDSVIPTRLWYA